MHAMSDTGAAQKAALTPVSAAARTLLVLIAALTLAGCTLPGSGPTHGAIMAGARTDDGLIVVPVTRSVAAAARPSNRPGFSPDLLRAGVVSAETFRAGDTVSLTIWENVETGLLAEDRQRTAVIRDIQVTGSGDVFVPYAGRIRAAGKGPDALREAIAAALSERTPDPQVEVRRVAGDGATVSVLGKVGNVGVYPIEQSTRRLAAMIARAGGVTIRPDIALVAVQRGNRTERIWLQDLYDNPANDIALRAGDRIIVEEDRRSFTALGATGRQARLPFTTANMTAMEAIAAVGGLNGNVANPTGVFVFRNASAEDAQRVTGRTDLVGTTRLAFVIDFSSADGFMSAMDFVMRDGDALYVTEAPAAQWRRIIGFASMGTTVINMGNQF